MEQIISAMEAFIQGEGLDTVRTFSREKVRRLSAPLVAVGLKQAEAASQGFYDYLGQVYNDQTECCEDLYGKRLNLEFTLNIYVPLNGERGSSACYEVFSKLSDALSLGRCPGIRVTAYDCGEITFDSTVGLCRCPCGIKASAFVYARQLGDGVFTDFILKGVVTNG